MAKTSSIEKNKRRAKLTKQFAGKRTKLKAITQDQSLPIEQRFAATIKLAALPRNSAETRVHNRCELTGRPRGYYRKFGINRIELRQLGNSGMIPGLTKSSW